MSWPSIIYTSPLALYFRAYVVCYFSVLFDLWCSCNDCVTRFKFHIVVVRGLLSCIAMLLCCELQQRVSCLRPYYLVLNPNYYETSMTLQHPRYLTICMVSEYSRASLFRAKIVIFCIILQDLLTRKFDSHSKLGIAYHVYDITGAEIVKR